MKKLTALGGNIFAGLFTQGIKQAGYDVIAHLEHGTYGVATALVNHPELAGKIYTHQSRWPDPASLEHVNFMFCNPACAAWSSARASRKGSWKDHTERLGCIDDLCTYGIALKPDAWCWESVTNALRHGRFFIDRIAEAWMDAGYSVTIVKQNNMYLGGAQNRPRILVVAHRYPLVYPPFTEPTTVRQALKGLHVSKAEKEEARLTAKGWDKVWELSENHGKMRRSFLALETKEAKEISRRPGFFSRRLMPDDPSPVNLDRTNQLHPFEPRMFTWSEMMRLCNLPADWKTAAARGSSFIELSRAVMPPVGEWIGKAVANGLKKKPIAVPVYEVFHCDKGPDKVFTETLDLQGDWANLGDLRRWDSAPPPVLKVRASRSPAPASGRQVQPQEPRRPGSGERIRELLQAGVAFDAILATIHKEFPASKATKSDVSWQRGKLRREGKLT